MISAAPASPARAASVAPLLVILIIAAPVYLWNLGTLPQFGGDEARIAIHSIAIAANGRDLDGTFLPLQIHVEELGRWYQPLLVYLMALAFKVTPILEWSARLPTAIIGLLDVVLIYFVSRRLFTGRWAPAVSAALLAFAPAHVIFARQAIDYICPLPFVLAWLWCLLAVIATESVPLAVLSGVILGVGVYSHVAAWGIMPFFLVMTWLTLRASGHPTRLSVIAAAGFVVPVIPLAILLLTHPGMAGSFNATYALYDARHLSLLQGIKEFFDYDNLEARISVYWDYFNPGFLFMSGGTSLTSATRRAGVLLLPLAVLLPCGVYRLWITRRLPIARVLLAGLLIAPVFAAVVNSPYTIHRAMLLLPFGALIATDGAVWMWARPGLATRLATVALLAGVPIHFATFHADYTSDYMSRSAIWFDAASFDRVADAVTAADRAWPAPRIDLSDAFSDGRLHWQFQMAKHQRADLWSQTTFIDVATTDVTQLPAGSLVVLPAAEPAAAAMVREGGCCTLETTVINVAGEQTGLVLRVRDAGNGSR